MIGDQAQWVGLTNGSYKGVTFHYAAPQGAKAHGAMSAQIHSGRRLQVSERPGVDGGRIRDFGAKADQHSLDVIFFGPNYTQDWENFKAILDEGTAGPLILPTETDIVNAFFSDRTEKSQVGGGNSKTIQITWIEDNSPVADITVDLGDVASAKSAIDSAIQGVASALSNNPFLQAVQATNTALSTVRNAVNVVLTLQQGVQNQIKQLQANIAGTIALVQQGINSIDSIFGSSTTSATAAATGTTLVDAVTGLPFSSVTDASVAPVSALFTPPTDASTVVIPIQNTDSEAGATALINTFVAALQDQQSQMVDSGGARTTDVKASITVLINSLTKYLPFIQSEPSVNILVKMELSLLEIIFQSQGSIGNYAEIYKNNPWIDDPLILPPGSVVTI